MKRLFLALMLALVLLVPAPASAATADWGLCGAGDEVRGRFEVFYTIDTNSLQVDSFTTVNNSTEWSYMYIREGGVDGTTIFDMLVAPFTTEVKPISNFKFRRVPATDHDDPNSVRYPQNTVMGCRWPAF